MNMNIGKALALMIAVAFPNFAIAAVKDMAGSVVRCTPRTISVMEMPSKPATENEDIYYIGITKDNKYCFETAQSGKCESRNNYHLFSQSSTGAEINSSYYYLEDKDGWSLKITRDGLNYTEISDDYGIEGLCEFVRKLD